MLKNLGRIVSMHRGPTVMATQISTSARVTAQLSRMTMSGRPSDDGNRKAADPVASDVIFTESKNQRAEDISRAMAYYLNKVAERESIMKVKTEEFEIGKRHLARIMGENPEDFGQKQIDEAISYLLPSGLYDKKARPFLKHPQEYYPKSRIAEFDRDGRPLHFLFFTRNSAFYQVIYDITQKILKLNKTEDALFLAKKGLLTFKQDANESTQPIEFVNRVDLTGSVWISQENLSKKLGIKVDDFNYKKFLAILQKLANHSQSKQEEEFINQFKAPFEPAFQMKEIPKLLIDEKGNSYQEIEARQRTARIKLRMQQGKGIIKITGPEGVFDITYFESLTHREQILFPFKTVDMVNKFDLEIEVNHGGMSCLAKAIRYAASQALCCFISATDIEKLRLAGLLTPDTRTKERKKPGQEGARRKYTWKKR